MSAALSGVRIIELGHALSVPFAVQLLADFGAEVIKIERPGTGDLFRPAATPFARDKDGKILESSGFLAINRNKKSIALDISKPEGQQIIRQLAAKADVLVENLKTGDLARHGLDYASLKGINPRLIYLSLTGFGQTGPYASRGGLDSIFQAMSGVMSLTGEPDGPPQRVGYLLADTTSGMYAALGMLIALYHRDAAGGAGQYIDLAMLDAMIAAMGSRVQGYLVSGEVPQRGGTSRGEGAAPAQPLPCKDGELSVSAALQTQFPNFCTVIGHPELMDDARFNTYQGRAENRHLLINLLGDIFCERTVSEWHELLVAGNVVCAPVYTIPQVLEDPQVRSRGVVSSMDHPTIGKLPIVRNPIHMDATPARYTQAPPLIGQHTDWVLSEFLGMSAGDIQALRAKGVVGSTPRESE
jgi:crotonobetainyl-CoA:carnitine CoA-transferase CaiB-like acyl-CoA transferase